MRLSPALADSLFLVGAAALIVFCIMGHPELSPAGLVMIATSGIIYMAETMGVQI